MTAKHGANATSAALTIVHRSVGGFTLRQLSVQAVFAILHISINIKHGLIRENTHGGTFKVSERCGQVRNHAIHRHTSHPRVQQPHTTESIRIHIAMCDSTLGIFPRWRKTRQKHGQAASPHRFRPSADGAWHIASHSIHSRATQQ